MDLSQFYGDVPVGVCSFNGQLVCQHMNEWLAPLCATSSGGAVGRNAADLFAPLDNDFGAMLRETLESGLAQEKVVEVSSKAQPKLLNISSSRATLPDGEEIARVIVQDITNCRLAHAAQQIAEASSRHRGEAFFQSTALAVSDILDADYVLIGANNDNEKNSIRTQAVVANGDLAENFEYELAGTPCEVALNDRVCSYKAGVADEFPEDVMLRDMGIEGYVGVALLDSTDEMLGVLAALWKTPAPTTRFAESILEMVAVRVGNEFERVRAETQLQRSEEKHRLLIERSPYCIHQIDLNGHLMSMNQAGLNMVGAQHEREIQGLCYFDFVSATDQARIRSHFHEAVTGRPSEFEFEAANGCVYSSSFIPMHKDGQVVRLMGLSQDITDRHQAERALRDSHALYQSLMRHLPQHVYQKDLDGRFLFVNQQFCDALGLQPNDLIGKTDFDLYPETLVLKYVHDDRSVITSGQRFETIEEHVGADGNRIVVQVIKSPVFDSEHRIVGSQGIFWDITEKMEMEAQLQRSERLSALGTLAAGVAHEINNPVAAALFSAETAREINAQVASDEKLESCLERIVSSMQRCQGITDQILRFSRQEGLELIPCDINTIVQESLSLLDAYIEQAGATMTLNLPESSPIIDGSPLELELAVGNIIRNGIQACEQDAEITIQVEAIQDKVRISIRDNGPGMTEEQRRRIFDPFYSTKQSKGGTGLGMSIVFGVVADHSGEVKVKSAPGEGTTIVIELPRSNQMSDISRSVA